jgi:hypothetical protein
VTDDPLATSFAAQLSELHRSIQDLWQSAAPEAGFVQWIARETSTLLGRDLPELSVDDLSPQRWGEAPVLAAIGFRLRGIGGADTLPERWRDGMDRLMARDAAPADRNSFLFRPVELLGIAMGAQAVATLDSRPATWLRGVIEANGEHLARSSILSITLNALAARRMAAAWEVPQRLDPRTAVDISVLRWLSLMDEGLAADMMSLDPETLDRSLLSGAISAEASPQGLAELGIFYIALQHAVMAAVGDLTFAGLRPAESIVKLCRRFPLLVTELADRYNDRTPFQIADEYDVQDLLRGLLRLHFDDVRAEEWNPSYGGVHSRSDLLLKAERVVVETKMTRPSLGQRELVQQLIVDKAQYQGHPDAGALVCFVYDPDHRLSNPTAIERDLTETDGALTTLVVISPRGL